MTLSTATPNILTDAGFLFWAPLGSTEPTNTVAGSVFTDTWPVAWLSLGATEDGSTFSYNTTVSPISAAEFFYPVKWATTGVDGSFAFNLLDYTLTNVKRAFNGGSIAVTGTGATTLSAYTPISPGAEVRCMLGWESLDSTVRIVVRQTINTGTIASAYKKPPSAATLPCEFHFEKPSGAQPFGIWSAGTARG